MGFQSPILLTQKLFGDIENVKTLTKSSVKQITNYTSKSCCLMDNGKPVNYDKMEIIMLAVL